MGETLQNKAEQIMDEAIAKAGDMLMEKPHIAEVILRQVLKCDPEHFDALRLLGLAKNRMAEFGEAVEIFQMLTELEPENPDNFNNLGLSYGGLQQWERAIAASKKAIEMKPSFGMFKNNLALQLRGANRYDEAEVALKQAVADSPDQAPLWLNLGNLYAEIRRYKDSFDAYKKAVEVDPNYPAAHVNLSFGYHLLGNWRRGFEEAEWRFFYYPQLRHYLNEYDQTKRWDGQVPLEGKTILVYGEQGSGDMIQSLRHLKALKDRGAAKVIYNTQKPLWDLARRAPGVDEVCERNIVEKTGPELPEYDYQCSSMSLPVLLDIPKITGEPYLEPATRKFRDHMEKEYGDTLNVGIVWAGSPAHPNDKNRSIHLRKFRPIEEMEGVRLFSLQVEKGVRVYGALYPDTKDGEKFEPTDIDDKVDFTTGAEDMKIVDLTNLIQSFEDTATLMAGLDLVICCDTSVAHLAGALGVPVWVLLPYNPDWRWGAEGETTPWYDSMRLFRQTEVGDWESVIERVKGELSALVLQNQ